MPNLSKPAVSALGDALTAGLSLAFLELGILKTPHGWTTYLLAAAVWMAVFFALGISKAGREEEKLSARLVKLGFDHVIALVVFIGALRFAGIDLGFVELCCFAGLSLGALAVRRASATVGRQADAGAIIWDALLVWTAFFSLPRLAWDGSFSVGQVLGFIALQVVLGYFCKVYQPDATPWRLARAVSQASFVAGVFVIVKLGAAHFPVSSVRLVEICAWHTVLVTGRAWLARRPPVAAGEGIRTGLLAAVACLVTLPYFSPNLVGTGEAKLYSEAMTDFLVQLKAGIFPPLVSQSEIAPFGSAFPFRMASYHFYLGAAINVLTAGRLSLHAVQNSTLIVSALAGVFTMYGVLLRLGSAPRWFAAVLAALYGLSPAWLGPLYSTDMYFTYMALPALPLVLLGAHRGLTASTWGNAVLCGAALAFAWLAHPPIGFWASVVVAALQLAAFPDPRAALPWLRQIAVTWATCGVLCAGLFVSLLELRIPGAQADPSGVVLQGIHAVFPALLQPVDDNPYRMSDIQPGYALLGLLAGALVLAIGYRQRAVVRWLVLSGLLLVLILPVPGLTAGLWKVMPYSVTTISNIWPMQRILPVLAALGTIAIALGFQPLFAAGRRSGTRVVLVACLLALAWSGFEASKYVRRGLAITRSPEETRRLYLTENSPMFINWAAFLPAVPASHSAEDGDDPRLLNRLLEAGTFRELHSNFNLVRQAGAVLPATAANAAPLHPGMWRLQPAFTLQLHERYLLVITPTAATVPGLLQISGPDFFRQIGRILPGGPVVETPLWTSLEIAQPLEFNFVPNDSTLASRPQKELFSYKFIPYHPETLPIRIESFAPYIAHVETAQATWLETHRFYLSGYRASVNGVSVAPVRSPEGLVMVPVPAGSDTVRLDYQGSLPLRLSLLLSALAWLALATWGVGGLLRKTRTVSAAATA